MMGGRRPFATTLSVIQRYGLALLSFAIALGLSPFLFSHKIEGIEFPPFLIGIGITLWFSGVGPAILALVLSALAFNYYFMQPYYTFYVTWNDVPYYLFFLRC